MKKIASVVGNVRCIWTGNNICGEGPIWSVEHQALYWVDIDGLKAYRYQFESETVDSWPMPEKTGWLLPCGNRSEWLAGCKSGIYLVDLDKNSFDFLIDPEPGSSENRINDGKIDASGRLWCGTMNDEKKIPSGWLYRIDSHLECTRCDGPYIVTNGPGISPDDKVLYHVDTANGIVYSFDKSSDGAIKNRRVFLKIDRADGKPDGLTVDDDGFIWLAHFRGGRISRFSSNAVLDGVLELPAPQVTSCTFGGPNMNILFITTAARNINLTEYPKAGNLFCVETAVRGNPSASFNLSVT